jgi:uncharacterized protein YeaO (DUF488 family)
MTLCCYPEAKEQAMPIQIKRIYDPEAPTDGKRILVDRLWPRGVSKERADLYGWFKDISPTPDLRTWFNHEPEHFEEFRQRYLQELEVDPDKQPEITQVLELSKQNIVTLLYGAKSPTINHAIVLQEFLQKQEK